VDVLREFLSEDVRDEPRGSVASWSAAEQHQKLWRADDREAMLEEIAYAVRTLRAEQLGLMKELTDTVIKWTIGTGIGVAALVIVAIIWL
jgi:hypothetical protein